MTVNFILEDGENKIQIVIHIKSAGDTKQPLKNIFLRENFNRTEDVALE